MLQRTRLTNPALTVLAKKKGIVQIDTNSHTTNKLLAILIVIAIKRGWRGIVSVASDIMLTMTLMRGPCAPATAGTLRGLSASERKGAERVLRLLQALLVDPSDNL